MKQLQSADALNMILSLCRQTFALSSVAYLFESFPLFRDPSPTPTPTRGAESTRPYTCRSYAPIYPRRLRRSTSAWWSHSHRAPIIPIHKLPISTVHATSKESRDSRQRPVIRRSLLPKYQAPYRTIMILTRPLLIFANSDAHVYRNELVVHIDFWNRSLLVLYSLIYEFYCHEIFSFSNYGTCTVNFSKGYSL